MEISMESINEVEDPYQSFVDSIKNIETFKRYKNNLYRFLKLIPSQIYRDILAKEPENNSIEELSKFFVELGNKDPAMIHNIIAAYIKEDKKKVEQKEISPNTFPTYIKPIRRLLDANSIPIHWKSLHRLFPRGSVSKDRAYTKQELQTMMDSAVDLTDKVIITAFSSAGFRLESWNYFTWRDVIFFQNDDETFKGAALLIYRGDPESYWTHLTSEACDYLMQYKELWKSQTGSFPALDDPLLKITKIPAVRRLNAYGVKKRLERLVRKTGIRDSLPEGKRRYEVPLAHGFRKYFNTMLRRVKVDYLDKEDMMGHKVGLERHYERYNEEDFERFPEYEKAIPFLTISDTKRIRFENEQLKEEKTVLQKLNNEKNELIEEYQKLEARTRRLESISSS